MAWQVKQQPPPPPNFLESKLQLEVRLATPCTVLQHSAPCCNAVQPVATQCTMLQHSATGLPTRLAPCCRSRPAFEAVSQRAACGGARQPFAARSVHPLARHKARLQPVATCQVARGTACCNVLQWVATWQVSYFDVLSENVHDLFSQEMYTQSIKVQRVPTVFKLATDNMRRRTD